MRIVIDNLDGLGPLDYGDCFLQGQAAEIVRGLNIPTECRLELLLEQDLGVPKLLARVQVLADSGADLFQGFVSEPAVLVSVGETESGAAYKVGLVASSDDAAYSTAIVYEPMLLLGGTLEQQWAHLDGAIGRKAQPAAIAMALQQSGRLEIGAGARWGETARSIAEQNLASYMLVNSQVVLAPLGAAAHEIAAEDAGLHLAVQKPDLLHVAEDVTVFGKQEPAAYVTEVFSGDGVTPLFQLAENPFRPLAGQKAAIEDLFQGQRINPYLWSVVDGSGHVALTADGLTCMGGSGRAGEALVVSTRQLELGGLLIVEGLGVKVGSGSDGVLLGLYSNEINVAGCFVGFEVSNVAGQAQVSALIRGQKAGAPLVTQVGAEYSFRTRLHTPEMERVRQSAAYLSASGVIAGGGQVVVARGYLEVSIQDVSSGLPGLPVILFAGYVEEVPPACWLGLIESGSLACSLKSVKVAQQGPLSVSVADAGASPVEQAVDSQVAGGACERVAGNGVRFYPATVPKSNSLVFVSYRLSAQAVARVGVVGTQGGSGVQWVGTLEAPVGWSSVDCENVANALVAQASGAPAGAYGGYKKAATEGDADIWPGDALQIGPYPDGTGKFGIVEKVKIGLTASCPDVFEYVVEFADGATANRSMKLSSKIPVGALLPQGPTHLSSALPSLTGLVVSAATGSTLSVDTGVAAPVGGGFEVRRRDGTFGPGEDSDLVLRSTARAISIPRLYAVEQYYIRMFDGATPPNYSSFSAAVFLNVLLQ